MTWVGTQGERICRHEPACNAHRGCHHCHYLHCGTRETQLPSCFCLRTKQAKLPLATDTRPDLLSPSLHGLETTPKGTYSVLTRAFYGEEPSHYINEQGPPSSKSPAFLTRAQQAHLTKTSQGQALSCPDCPSVCPTQVGL